MCRCECQCRGFISNIRRYEYQCQYKISVDYSRMRMRILAPSLVWCTRLIQTLLTVCSVSFYLLPLQLDITELQPQLIHWSLRYQGVEHPNLLGFPAGSGWNVEWPSLNCVWHWHAGWVQEYSQPLVASLSCVFFSFPWCRCLWGRTSIYKQLCFSHLGLCCWF